MHGDATNEMGGELMAIAVLWLVFHMYPGYVPHPPLPSNITLSIYQLINKRDRDRERQRERFSRQ